MNELLRPKTPPTAPVETERPAPLWHRLVAGVIKGGAALAILVAAGWLAMGIYSEAPVPTRFDPERRPRPVEVEPARAAARGPVVEAWGAVEPARRLAVSPEAGGRVHWVSPALEVGAVLSRGATLLRLDDGAARRAVRRAEARLAGIDARMRRERGQRQRARADLERASLEDLSGEERALILREPQMRELEAERAQAEADLEEARETLEETRLTAPFAGEVVSEDVETGAMLSAGETAAVLVGTEAHRVVLSVPQAAIERLRPLAGREVRLTQPGVWPEGAVRTGRVQRLAPELSEQGRMARLIVRVADPLARDARNEGAPRLLVGSYLRAEIEGPPVSGAVALAPDAVRGGDTVWVMNDKEELEIREVRVAWRGPDRVIVSGGLAPGERVVRTYLATPADGMSLTTGEGG